MNHPVGWLEALLFPPRCSSCGQLMRPEAVRRDKALCPKCREALEAEMRHQCPRCFLEYAACRCVPGALRERGICAYVKLAPYDLQAEYSVVRNLVLGIKEHPSRRTFRFLATELSLGVSAAVTASERSREKQGKAPLETVITYLPRSKRGVSRTGFDQARELARALSGATGYRFLSLLGRARDGSAQKALTRGARAENLRGAFAKKGPDVSGFRVLLVDDVVTTGAGMVECAKQLKCAELVAVSVAYTEKKRAK